MISFIVIVVMWIAFITIYVKHTRKVREFTKVNPNFFSSTDNEKSPQKKDTSLEDFLQDQQEKTSSPVYEYLPYNIYFDPNKH